MTYHFRPKDCPFCDGNKGRDDRTLRGLGVCEHQFTQIEMNAMIIGTEELKKQIKSNKKVIRKMQKIIERINNDSICEEPS